MHSAGTVPMSSRIRAGGRCCSRTCTPNGVSASSIAFTIAAGATIIPPSPTPRKFTSGSSSTLSTWWISMLGTVGGRRQQVVHERPREELAVVAVGRLLEQHGADRLGDAAADLALDDRRVDGQAAVLDHHVALDLDDAGLDVDLDEAAVRAAGPAALAAVVLVRCVEVAVDVVGKPLRLVGDDRAPARRTTA